MGAALGAIGLVVLASILAVLVPRLWVRLARLRRGGPLIHSLIVFDGPLVLYPGTAPGPTQASEFGLPTLPAKGTAFGWQTVRLTFRGLDSKPVIITKLEPVILSRDAPLEGWFQAPELGGGQDVHFLVADLDAPTALFRLVDDTEANCLVGHYAFRVTATDVEHVELEVFSTSARIRWGIDVHYDADGQPGIVEVRDSRLDITAEGPNANPFVWQPPGHWEPGWGCGFAAERAMRWRSMRRRDGMTP